MKISKLTTNYDTKKCDLEVQKRISICLEFLINGLTPKEILIQNEVVSWCVSKRQIERYIQKANETIKNEVSEKHSYIIAIVSKRYDTLYKLCIESKNYKVALNSVTEQAKLFGLMQSNTFINQNIQNHNHNENYSVGNIVSNNDNLIKLASDLSMAISNESKNFENLQILN